jgi:hypothetical protein
VDSGGCQTDGRVWCASSERKTSRENRPYGTADAFEVFNLRTSRFADLERSRQVEEEMKLKSAEGEENIV